MFERDARAVEHPAGGGDGKGMIPTTIHIDPAYVQILSEEFGELAVQLIDLLEITAFEGLAEIDAAVARGDEQELRRVAHRLKGGCQNLGAVSMGNACLELESGAADPAVTAAELRAAVIPTLDELRALATQPV
jgi:HPt (histidine-containing phosphotransfer) domain-containing protein